MSSQSKPIFYDPKGSRAQRLKWLQRAAALLVAVLSTGFVASLFVVPALTQPVRKASNSVTQIAFPSEMRAKAQVLLRRDLDRLRKQLRTEHAAKVFNPKSAKSIVIGFDATDNAEGLDSLRTHADRMTHWMPTWLRLFPDGTLDTTGFQIQTHPNQRDALAIARRHGLKICPILSNADGDIFDSKRVEAMMQLPATRHALIDSVVKFLVDQKFDGINLDLESLTQRAQKAMPLFVSELGAALHRSGLELSYDLEVSKIASVKPMLHALDYVVLMAYDEHATGDEAGPIASRDWVQGSLEQALQSIPASKVVLGIGAYAYDWDLKTHKVRSMSFHEAISDAAGYRDDIAASEVVQWDPASGNTTFTYSDDDDHAHRVWLLDALSAWDQATIAQDSGVRGMAVWDLGQEDATIWSVLGSSEKQPPDPKALEQLFLPYEVEFVGTGEGLKVVRAPTVGHRLARIDADTGFVDSATYTSLPSGYVLKRFGSTGKKLALTFDDGPDANFTPPILDSLQQLGVKATFFVIGQNAEDHPALLRRIFREGHEVGSHSFTHPNMGAISPMRGSLELNATQRAIQGIIGRSTVLFRPPYNADAEPTTGEQVRPVVQASDLGYVTVGEKVDPNDWDASIEGPDGTLRPRTPEDIADLVVASVEKGDGNIILLHDGGGNRAATVQALKLMVPRLKAKGYQFVTAGELLGMPRDVSMPALRPSDVAIVGFDELIFRLVFGAQSVLGFAFVLGLALGLLRMLVVLPLAWKQSVQERGAVYTGLEPSVAVIIAAYNEREVIERTITTALSGSYPVQEVVVVDDGSTDGTGDLVRKTFGSDPRVKVITVQNGGKARALNYALAATDAKILVAVDADTQLDTDAISYLVRRFEDERVGAVAGNVKVGNRNGLITWWQSIEYIASQNVERRALSALNAVTVVPGAIGAWRRKALVEIGAYTSDTMAEDMDITWRMRMSGWIVVADNRAVAWTEAPESAKALLRQRFRWTFGTLQCLWKHRQALGKFGSFGRLALPAVILFQFVFVLISPAADLLMLWALAGAGWSGIHSMLLGSGWRLDGLAVDNLSRVAMLYGLGYTVEMAVAAYAFRLDREKAGALVWIALQRLLYRQLLVAATYKAVWTAAKGMHTVWSKLERSGSVKIPNV